MCRKSELSRNAGNPRLLGALFLILILSTGGLAAQTGSEKPGAAVRPFILGQIEEIQSTILGETRTLNIYLPAGYNQNDTTRYPVIYLLDGSADEDFIHVAGIVQFLNFPWLNQLPESILVGIANTDRKRDFTFPTTVEEHRIKFPEAGHSDRFIGFIEKELQPFIAKKFRTQPSRMVIGQSLGGLLATQILVEKPELFNRYLIISPSLWWDNGSLLKRASAIRPGHFSQPTDIYISVGDEGPGLGNPATLMQDDARQLADRLKASGNSAARVVFEFLPLEDHGTIGHLAVFNGFRALYPKAVAPSH